METYMEDRATATERPHDEQYQDEPQESEVGLAAEPVQAERKPSVYLVLVRDLEDSRKWAEAGTYTALHPDGAKEQAVAAFPSLEEQINQDGGLTLVAVAQRYWKPTTATVEQTTRVRFS